MTSFTVVLFDGFETLDAFGPVEVMGKLSEEYALRFHSMRGGIVKSGQQVPVDTLPFAAIDPSGILLIPGGMGTRSLACDKDFIERIKLLSEKASYVLTVCTGSALLAQMSDIHGRETARAIAKGIEYVWNSDRNDDPFAVGRDEYCQLTRCMGVLPKFGKGGEEDV